MATYKSELQASKRPCKVITVQEKFAILKQLEAGFSRRDVVDMFNCSQSTISRVLSGKEVIVKDAEDNVHSKRENILSYKELDRVMSIWAKEMINSNGLITFGVAKQKAEELALVMGLDLKPSTGWLYKWKEREKIKFAKRTKDSGEILQELFDSTEKCVQEQKANEDNSKRIKLAEEEVISNDPEKNQQVESEHNQSLADNVRECEKKPRKRDYIKRLPILDATGLICRSRKEKTFLTLLQKLEILERLKNGERRPDLTAEYNLSNSAMSQIVTDEEKILKLAAGGQNLLMKRIRGGIFKDGEAELNAWVKKKLEQGASLTRTQIKNRAKEIAERLNIEFKASTGWLEKWKTRMNLDFNENQLLQRKLPKYIASDEEVEKTHAQFEHSDSFYEQQGSEMEEKQFKDEQLEDDYCNELETTDKYTCDDNDEVDVKPELLTPQQFYLQTIQAGSDASQSCSDRQKENKQKDEEQLKPVEEVDIKPLICTPPHISQTEQAASSSENLQEQLLQWLYRYNIASGAASELLNILKPHLWHTNNTVQFNLNV